MKKLVSNSKAFIFAVRFKKSGSSSKVHTNSVAASLKNNQEKFGEIIEGA
jgi:hypothetical protein